MAWELAMATTRRQENDPISGRVFVSNTAANMISSLHPFDRTKARAALSEIKSSVVDPTKVMKINGVDNAFVARAGDLRVIFEMKGDSVVITSVLARGANGEALL